MIYKNVLEVIRQSAREHNTPEAVVEAVLAKMLPSIRLTPHAADEFAIGASRIGGCPDLPKGTRWPKHKSASFRFVMQVNLAEVAAFDVAKVLPKKGLLSFFYTNVEATWPDPEDIAFIALNETDDLRRLRWPSDLPEHRRYRPLALTPGAEWTMPSIEDSGVAEDEIDSDFPHFDFFREVEARIATAQGYPDPHTSGAILHRLLGHPQLIHSPGLADGTRLLLQVDSDPPSMSDPDSPRTGMTWGDCGRIFYLSTDADRKKKRLTSKPWVLWEP